MAEDGDLRRASERIEGLIEEIRGSASPPLWARVDELVRSVVALYGAGLQRIVRVLRDAGEVEAIADRLAADELVSSLLALHGLHPDSLAERLRRALDGVRPYLAAHGGEVELVSADEGLVRLRRTGGRDGCPSSALTVTTVLESAILRAAPEVARIEVDHAVGPPRRGGLIPADSLVRRGRGEAARAAAEARPVERQGEACEMCAARLAPEHAHVVDVERRRLLCACRACSLLFAPGGAAQGSFRAVPERSLRLVSFRLGTAQWEALQVPVGMAFFVHSSALGRVVAFYPGPAGVTESLLPLPAWREIADANPALAGLEPDVEALLVYAPRGREPECFLVPVDACYALAGALRRRWRGFDGGEEARKEIEEFFARLRERGREA